MTSYFPGFEQEAATVIDAPTAKPTQEPAGGPRPLAVRKASPRDDSGAVRFNALGCLRHSQRSRRWPFTVSPPLASVDTKVEALSGSEEIRDSTRKTPPPDEPEWGRSF